MDGLLWASGGMADASVSKSDICEYVGVQVPPRPPQCIIKIEPCEALFLCLINSKKVTDCTSLSEVQLYVHTRFVRPLGVLHLLD